MISINEILVPVDFSDTSEQAVKYGISLARNFGAKLHMLHVSSKASYEMATEFPIGLAEAAEEAVKERLLKILTPQEYRELRPEFVVRSGAPSMEIARFASERAIDLIVMGTHGRTGIAHTVLGSVAEKVVRIAPCPVLTVRAASQHGFITADETVHAAPAGL